MDVEAGGVEQKVVVLVGAHVLAVQVLVGLHVAYAVAGPLELFEVELFQCQALARAHQQRVDPVGLELHDHVVAGFLGFLVVVHQFFVGDAAVLGRVEEAVKTHWHTLGLFQPHAGQDAFPACVVSGLGGSRLLVGADHGRAVGHGVFAAHAATPIQFLHRCTASTALTPKASAPV